MNITKEALLERGFMPVQEEHGLYCFPENGHREVWVRFGDEPYVFISRKNKKKAYDTIAARNATTIEDIDHLIRLFIK